VRIAKARVAAAMVQQREVMGAIIAATPKAAPAAGAPAPAKPDDFYDAPPTDDRARLERELAASEREIQNRKQGIKPNGGKQSDIANRIITLETEWKSVNRERDKARQWQSEIDERLFRAKANAASELNGYNAQVKVLDPAFLPTEAGGMPVNRFTTIGILVSVLVGLVFAAAWGMFLDDRLFMADEVVAFAPVLAVIPKAPAEKGKRRA
jgi:hypothetical protein